MQAGFAIALPQAMETQKHKLGRQTRISILTISWGRAFVNRYRSIGGFASSELFEELMKSNVYVPDAASVTQLIATSLHEPIRF